VKCVLVALALVLAATPAAAQTVPRRESGSVRLSFGSPLGLDAPVVVREGEVAWRETARPANVVRLLSTAPVRNRPGPVIAVPAGTILYGYELSSGTAYCPRFDLGSVHVRRVQCFRDFDNDGDFDGAYVADPIADYSVLPSRVWALTAIVALPYEHGPFASPDIPVSVSYLGMRDGEHRFRLRIEEARWEIDLSCAPLEQADECSILLLHLRVTPQGDGAIGLSLIAQRERRGVQVEMQRS
jgi:hypothetical protein